MGEPSDNTNKKIEILNYVNSEGSTTIRALEPKIGISDTGARGNYIKPSNSHAKTTEEK